MDEGLAKTEELPVSAQAGPGTEVPADEPTLTKLIEIVAERLEWPTDNGAPGPHTQIGEDGLGLDSLMVVELALDIEEEFDLEIDEDTMLDIGKMTLAQVAQLVDARASESTE